jgi:peptidoglycan/LPS O-acetylase OafA/YrhL
VTTTTEAAGVPAAAVTHMPGITGLRGIAVSAVVAYHLGYLPGGYLGVDLFFVLSGFLITSLLLTRPPVGASGLARWWSRRFTRLTPAVGLVVLVVLVAFASRPGVVLDAVATLTWWQNWHLIAEGQPYWAGSPSPLRHAWSLSIEEQFYLVWPLSVMGLLSLARRRGGVVPERLVAGVAAVLAVASFAWAALLASGGEVPLSRIYFGTDTRAGALLLGCTAAALLRLRPPTGAVSARLGALGVTAAVGLAALSVFTTPEQRWMYTGGLVLAAACSLVVILVAARPGPAERLLDRAPLQWLGVRSYAIYLWSWPVQVLSEDRGLSKPLVAMVTVVASLVLSSVSLRLVEEPMRRAGGWARRLTPRRSAWMGGAAAIIAAMVFAASSTQLTVAEQVAEEFERLPDPTVPSTTTTTCVPPPPSEPVPTFSDDTTQFDRSTVERPVDPSGTPYCMDAVTKVLVVGDSTGRGAVNGLRRLGASDLEVWDRTDLGCGLVSTEADCPDWRATWAAALDEVDPEVVVAYMRTSDDLVPGPDPDFTSPEGAELRRNVMNEATDVLSSTGAQVIWVLPAAPLPRGAFYCDGIESGSACDPAWVELWRADLDEIATLRGIPTIDVQEWVDGRPATVETDRPDGLHFSGPALDAHASWLLDQVRSVT